MPVLRQAYTLIGADGETRTLTAFATAPSRRRVYQFHHVGKWTHHAPASDPASVEPHRDCAASVSLFWYLLHPAAIRRNRCGYCLLRGRYGLTRRLPWNAAGQRLRRSALLRDRRSAHDTFFIGFPRQHVGESHARQEKYDSKNRRRATQKVCRAGRAEHTAGRAAAKRGADISAFPVLQQHESDDAERGHHVKNQNQNFHSSTIKPRRWPPRRCS